MSDPEARPSVTGIAGSVVEGLKTQPILLVIVLLNMVFAVAAGYYLENVDELRARAIDKLIDKCFQRQQGENDVKETYDASVRAFQIRPGLPEVQGGIEGRQGP